MLITFEGIEGSGKTTQIELLSDYLSGEGHSVVKTREPGGTGFGEALREVLLKNNMDVDPLSELLVFMAMRAQHVEEVILPALQDGKVILCDRFIDATYAYQGYGRKIDLGVIETLNRLVTKGIRPNLTILMNVTAERGLKRKAAASLMDRIEEEDISFHQRVKKAYEKLAKEDPKRFFVVDGSLKVEAIHEIVREKTNNVLKSYGV
ncbi:MAG: dTMP kinase [Syntrophorhabdaceae bacterium]|nr:dTMP kinase [Syntrophorhabdaceae bacterium]